MRSWKNNICTLIITLCAEHQNEMISVLKVPHTGSTSSVLDRTLLAPRWFWWFGVGFKHPDCDKTSTETTVRHVNMRRWGSAAGSHQNIPTHRWTNSPPWTTGSWLIRWLLKQEMSAGMVTSRRTLVLSYFPLCNVANLPNGHHFGTITPVWSLGARSD